MVIRPQHHAMIRKYMNNVPGLSLQIFLDQGNYMLNKLTPNAGAKLVIHEAENPPLPDEKGIDLQPNTETSVAIQKVQSGASGHSLGFVNKKLGSSPSLLGE